MRRIAAGLALAAAGAGALACQDTLGPLLVTAVVLKPAVDTVGLGQAVPLRATLTRARGDTVTGLHIAWSSSDSTVVTVDTTGYSTAVGVGTATVTAEVGVQSGSAMITVTDSAPTISRVTPSIGTAGTRVTIHGTHFRPGAGVSFDTLAADAVVIAADSVIQASVPAVTTAGTGLTVTVRNSDGSKVAVSSLFRISAPVLLFLNGAVQAAGAAGSPVRLEGQAFGDQQGAGQVFFSDSTGAAVPAVMASPSDWTNTTILTVVPAGAATGRVSVQTASGVSDSVPFTIAAPPTFTPSALAWTAGTALPVGLSGHAAVGGEVDGGNFVYVVGGADDSGAPRKDVSYSAIQGDGQLSGWTATAPLPTAAAFAAAVIATPANSRIRHRPGSIYVLGGVATPGGDPVATVFQGVLNADGSVAAWSGAGLPLPLHSAGAVIYHGDLYLAGGSTTGDVPVAGVYRARIDSLGVLGPWQAEPALPFARSYAAVGAAGGYLYVLGGDSAATGPDDASAGGDGTRVSEIAYAKIDLASGDLAAAGWTVNAGPLGKAVSKLTGVFAGGNVLITGGLYGGAATDSSEQNYAALSADGSVGSFTNATGSHTIMAAGGQSLFNHATATYVDGNGVVHVIVLGGDDVNAPGTKRAEVWVY